MNFSPYCESEKGAHKLQESNLYQFYKCGELTSSAAKTIATKPIVLMYSPITSRKAVAQPVSKGRKHGLLSELQQLVGKVLL